MQYQVVERFVSINGEGLGAGTLAVFIRFAGCNLACNYCDTAWANEADVAHELMTAESIYNYVISTGINNVTLTGGEPFCQEGIMELIKLLAKNPKLRIEVETNGSQPLDSYVELGAANLVFTMDYKLAFSGMEPQMLTSNFGLLGRADVVKFVVQDTSELDQVSQLLTRHQLAERTNVHLSPAWGMIEPSILVEYMLKHGLNDVRLQLQLHKIIWDKDRRGV